jgi:hypothetical protein
MARSLGRLRDRLLEDIQVGEKIFVYRTIDHVLSISALEDFGAVFASIGSGTFLYVKKGTSPFIVEQISKNVLVAQIDEFATDRPQLRPNVEGWHRVCRNVLQHQSRRDL